MLNLKDMIEPLVRRGLPAKEVFKTLVSEYPDTVFYPATVYRVVHKLGGKTSNWFPSEDQRKRVAKMITNGLKYEDIARLMGVSVKSIYNLNVKHLHSASPYKKRKKINRDTFTKEELEHIYIVTLRTMTSRYRTYRDDVPSAVADAIIELQNKPKTDKAYAECVGIASRRLIDHVRIRYGRRGSKRNSVKFEELYDTGVNPDYSTDTEDEIAWLRERVSELESPHREVITVYLETGCNCSATARALGVSEPTAAKYVQAAIKRLRDELD